MGISRGLPPSTSGTTGSVAGACARGSSESRPLPSARRLMSGIAVVMVQFPQITTKVAEGSILVPRFSRLAQALDWVDQEYGQKRTLARAGTCAGAGGWADAAAFRSRLRGLSMWLRARYSAASSK